MSSFVGPSSVASVAPAKNLTKKEKRAEQTRIYRAARSEEKREADNKRRREALRKQRAEIAKDPEKLEACRKKHREDVRKRRAERHIGRDEIVRIIGKKASRKHQTAATKSSAMTPEELLQESEKFRKRRLARKEARRQQGLEDDECTNETETSEEKLKIRLASRVRHRIRRQAETKEEKDMRTKLRKMPEENTPEIVEERCFVEYLLAKLGILFSKEYNNLIKEGIRIEYDPDVPSLNEEDMRESTVSTPSTETVTPTPITNPVETTSKHSGASDSTIDITKKRDNTETDSNIPATGNSQEVPQKTSFVEEEYDDEWMYEEGEIFDDEFFDEAVNKRQPEETEEEWIARVSKVCADNTEPTQKSTKNKNTKPGKPGRAYPMSSEEMERHNAISMEVSLRRISAPFKIARERLEKERQDPADVEKRKELDSKRGELEARLISEKKKLLEKSKAQFAENLKKFSKETLEERTARINGCKEVIKLVSGKLKQHQKLTNNSNNEAGQQQGDEETVPEEQRLISEPELSMGRRRVYKKLTEEDIKAQKAKNAANARVRVKMEQHEYNIFVKLESCGNFEDFESLMAEELTQKAVEYWGEYVSIKAATEIFLYRDKFYGLLKSIRELTTLQGESDKSSRKEVVKGDFMKFKEFLAVSREVIKDHVWRKMNYPKERAKLYNDPEKLRKYYLERYAKLPQLLSAEELERRRVLHNAKYRRKYQKQKFGIDLGLGGYMKNRSGGRNKNYRRVRTEQEQMELEKNGRKKISTGSNSKAKTSSGGGRRGRPKKNTQQQQRVDSAAGTSTSVSENEHHFMPEASGSSADKESADDRMGNNGSSDEYYEPVGYDNDDNGSSWIPAVSGSTASSTATFPQQYAPVSNVEFGMGTSTQQFPHNAFYSQQQIQGQHYNVNQQQLGWNEQSFTHNGDFQQQPATSVFQSAMETSSHYSHEFPFLTTSYVHTENTDPASTLRRSARKSPRKYVSSAHPPFLSNPSAPASMMSDPAAVGNLNSQNFNFPMPSLSLVGAPLEPNISSQLPLLPVSLEINTPPGSPSNTVIQNVQSEESSEPTQVQKRKRGRAKKPPGAVTSSIPKKIQKRSKSNVSLNPKPAPRPKSPTITPNVPNDKIIEMGMNPENIRPKCKYCDKFFHTALQLEGHMKKCELASNTKENNSTVVKRKKQVSKNSADPAVKERKKQWACKLCLQKLRSAADLERHFAWCHFEEKTYTCPFCPLPGFGLPYKYCLRYLYRHIRENHPDKSSTHVVSYSRTSPNSAKDFMCFICRETFTEYSNAVKHFTEAHEKFRYWCEFCGIILKRTDHLKDHMKFFHPEEQIRTTSENAKEFDPVFECDICFSEFSSQMFLEQHQIYSHDCTLSNNKRAKKYDSGCDKRFYMKYKKTDNPLEECSVPCFVCDNRFPSEATLQQHFLKNHVEDNSIIELKIPKLDAYKCEACPTSCRSLFHLRKHCILTHNLGEHIRKIKHLVQQEQENLEYPPSNLTETELGNEGMQSTSNSQRSKASLKYPKISDPNEANKTPEISVPQTDDNDEAYRCPECLLPFSQKGFHESHRNYSKLLRRYCKPCDRMFSKSNVYVIHNKSAHGIIHETSDLNYVGYDPLKEDDEDDETERFTCNVCAEQFTLKQFHRHHSFFKKDPDRRFCSICNKHFYYSSIRHQKMFHSSSASDSNQNETETSTENAKGNESTTELFRKKQKKQINLSEEDYEKLSSSTLIPTATGEMEIWTCKLCLQNFKTKDFLRSHITNSHSTEYTLSRILCDICNKTFASRNNLQKHKKNFHRPNLTRFQCYICSIITTTLPNMKVHVVKMHEKVFDRTLVKKIPLKKVHEENSAIPCQFCNRGFSTADKLKVHMTNIHFRFNFTSFCQHCGLQTPPEYLAQHIERNHSTEMANERPARPLGKVEPTRRKVSLLELVELLDEIMLRKEHEPGRQSSKTSKRRRTRKSRKTSPQSEDEVENPDRRDSSSDENWDISDDGNSDFGELSEDEDAKPRKTKALKIKGNKRKSNKSNSKSVIAKRKSMRQLTTKRKKYKDIGSTDEESESDESQDADSSEYGGTIGVNHQQLIDRDRIAVVVLENCDELYEKLKRKQASKRSTSEKQEEADDFGLNSFNDVIIKTEDGEDIVKVEILEDFLEDSQ